MNGHERQLGRRLQTWIGSVSAVAATWVFATGALATATVELSTSDGAPGGTVKVTMSIAGEAGDPAFAGTQVDLIVDRSQLGIDAQCSGSGAECDSGLDCEDAEACGLISCELDSRLPAPPLQLIANSPRFQNVPTSNKRLRLGIVGPAIPVTTFDDGVVLTCDLDVPESAALGTQVLSADRLVVSDDNGDVIASQVVIIPGRIVEPTELTPAMTATPTPTETPTGGGGTPTSTPTNTSVPPTSTPTSGGGDGTPTSTPTSVGPTATHTGTTGGTPTATPTDGGGGGGGGGCDCAIGPESDQNRGTAPMWLSLLPVALLWWRRSRGL